MMIEFQSVSKSFGSKKAVDDLTLKVNAGEIFGFLGPNGAGKTTTIKMLVGLLAPSGGEIFLDGVNVQTNSLEAKRKLSFVPDNPDIYDKMTGIQYLNFLGNIYRLTEDEKRARIEKYAKDFEMTDALTGLISGYSHGMQQKICLIGALLHEPKALILDEPMVGLDPKSSFRLKELMRERCEAGNTVFFSTHVMEVAEKICDRLAIINHGKVIAVGTMDEIRSQVADQGSLEKIFLELTEE